MQKMAQSMEDARAHLPDSMLAYVPADADALRIKLVEWLRLHAGSLQLARRDFGRALVYVLMGMIIGALLSLQKAPPRAEQRPLSTTIIQYAARLATALRRAVIHPARHSATHT